MSYSFGNTGIDNRFRIEEGDIFEHGTTQQVFIKAIDDSSKRKKSHKIQQKALESLITNTFQVKIEMATQWDFWIIVLESNFKMIIGANEIALSYVILTKNTPEPTTQPTWEVKENLGAPHNGTAYVQDKFTLHNILLGNISDGSDSFTYVIA